jgi:hypothetical protein
MTSWEVVSVNTRTGYGNKSGWIEKDGARQNFESSGTDLSADLAVGFTHKNDDGRTREKRSIDLLTVKSDNIIGQAQDRYSRLIINFGADIHGDDTYSNGLRFAWRGGVAAQLQTTTMTVNKQTVSGNCWNVVLPLGLGLGFKQFFLQDKFEPMLEAASDAQEKNSLKLKNEASLSWRPYVNLNNRFLQTVDIFFSHIFESGQMTENIKERSNHLLVGLKLGLFNYSLPEGAKVEL